eukprot:GHVL01028252.1.p1 GENE.GHVL01028252.1~~GHVL01028252.1.p1  ORF type:complete len:432 (+),score=73.17 GHVL01028252.1:722-2017(+)
MTLSTVPQNAKIRHDIESGNKYSNKDGLLVTSDLNKAMQELTNNFVALEHLFMLKAIDKAVNETDEIDWENENIFTSTLVDDVFCIVRDSISRAVSGGDVFAVCAVVNHVSSTLGVEYFKALQDNLIFAKTCYQPYIQQFCNVEKYNLKDALLRSLAKGETLPKGSKQSWPHCLSNIDVSCDYIDALKRQSEKEFDENFSQSEECTPRESGQIGHSLSGGCPGGSDEDPSRTMFRHCLQGLDQVKSELKRLHAWGCKAGLQMLKCHLSPALKPLDIISFNLTKDEFDDYSVNDPFLESFLAKLAVIHGHLQKTTNQNTFASIMHQVAEQVCKRLEMCVIDKAFSLYGGLFFDSQVRRLQSYCASISEQSVRPQFLRLNDIGTLLSLENIKEFVDYWGPTSGKNSPLSEEEIKKVLSLRTDMDSREIDSLFD